VIADFVDLHVLYLAYAQPKPRSRTPYADEPHCYRWIEFVAQIKKGNLRVLDLMWEDLRNVIAGYNGCSEVVRWIPPVITSKQSG
jgi:hypothetical protein